MTRFHINDAGNPGECRALHGQCPFGSESEHHASAEEARKAYEVSMETEYGVLKQAVSKLEQRVDLLHNMNVDRTVPYNLVTAYDGDRVFAVYEGNGPEGYGYYASFGTAWMENDKLRSEVANISFIVSKDESEALERVRDFSRHHLRGLPRNSAVRNSL